MRRFVVIGQRALATSDFSLEDLPGTSGRLDVLVRCLRAAMLVSHGVRRDVRVYLVLQGGPRAPRVVRFDGPSAKFLRPDERSLATLVRKSLAGFEAQSSDDASFVEVRPGIAVASGGLALALDDIGRGSLYVLDAAGDDVRTHAPEPDCTVVLGDHLGLDDEARALLAERRAASRSLGPVVVQAEDAIVLLHNELDRRHPA